MDHESDEESRWHLDKKVPISIIAAMLFQFAGGVWFLSRLESRVIALEASKSEQRDRDERQDRNHDSSLSLIRQDIQTVANKLDRLIERETVKK